MSFSRLAPFDAARSGRVSRHNQTVNGAHYLTQQQWTNDGYSPITPRAVQSEPTVTHVAPTSGRTAGHLTVTITGRTSPARRRSSSVPRRLPPSMCVLDEGRGTDACALCGPGGGSRHDGDGRRERDRRGHPVATNGLNITEAQRQGWLELTLTAARHAGMSPQVAGASGQYLTAASARTMQVSHQP